MIRSARGNNDMSAVSASARSKRPPAVATITGSTTVTGGFTAANQSRTVSITSTDPSMPTLTASRVTSELTASSWDRRMCTGGVWMSITPVVFWATTAVITFMP